MRPAALGPALVVALALAGGWWLVELVRADEAAWKAWAREHECRVVGRERASVASTTGVNSAGAVVSGVTVVPGRTGYACNDGVTYWR